MRFHADLHVHSKYWRATSRDLDLEHLAHWAARKGVGVVGTGDFVHPGWLAELKHKLVPAEPGLFRLNDEIEAQVARTLPACCRTAVRFMLEVEISTIYKKAERTRKIHHLIYAPDFATVDRIAARLERIGNIASDGRPILGLDSRDLLEITLESSPDAYLVPAHIWTPWFAALGSQSGFDSIAACYGDLAGHIFAVETGLSSDPAMNWRVSFLDRYRLTSNSDAHSPGKLGREATRFDCALDYFAIRRALETGDGYGGTVEFFPEEGKYHLDGHRKCGVRLTPKETLANGGRCPACGEPVTVGVAHRVEALADRGEADVTPPATAGAVSNLVALPEILSELAASGPASKTVERGYDRLIASLGPELSILGAIPIEDITRAGSSLLGEAVSRLRDGKVICEAGYDGEYGVIRLFEPDELRRRTAGGLLFEAPTDSTRVDSPLPDRASEAKRGQVRPVRHCEQRQRRSNPDEAIQAAAPPSWIASPSARNDGKGVETSQPSDVLAGLDGDQRAAAATVDGPVLIVAGPGSGKTRTLTHRIAHLVAERGVAASACLAITFTRRAAAEMRERLARLLPATAGEVAIHTFHSLGLAILREHGLGVGLDRDFRIAAEAERKDLLIATLALSERKADALLRAISKAKRTGVPPSGDIADAITAYGRALARRNWIDFDDLVRLSVGLLAADPALAARTRERYRFISVDEFQDVDEQQYRLLRLLAPPDGNLCVIGDPDQAIYGFRGADASGFDRFRQDHPCAVTVQLARNYRSTGTIVAASLQVIARSRRDEALAEVARDMHERITVHAAPTEHAEAEFVVATVERLIGGHSFFSIDSGRAGIGGRAALSFSDFAVLYRTDGQSAALAEALARSGMPFKKGAHARLIDRPAVRALAQALDKEADDAALAVLLSAAAERLQAHKSFDPAAIAEALQLLKMLAETCGRNRSRFTEAVALATDADFCDPRADRVSLLTMHAAKGLEFPVVFVVGLEDGLMPLRWGEPDGAAEAEERRLLYVAMTRAKDRLFLSRAVERLWRGRRGTLDPSPFLRDIEAELVKHQLSQLPRRPPANRQLSLF
jgi:ATP-dependent DNA helicase UvrD/PcrA